MISFNRIRYLLQAYPEAQFRLERAYSRATGGASMLPDPEPEQAPGKHYLKPLTCPRGDRMEMAVYSIIKARETADALRKELSDLQAELAEKIKIKKIEGDALTVIQMRYWDGYGISKIAANVLGQKTEKERNRIKYILRKTENQLNN